MIKVDHGSMGHGSDGSPISMAVRWVVTHDPFVISIYSPVKIRSLIMINNNSDVHRNT